MAARLSESVGAHEAARRLGVPERHWVTGSGGERLQALQHLLWPQAASAVPMRRPVSELEAECSRLRRELADAKLDVEMLRKAGRRTLQGDRDEVR